MTLRIS